MSEIIPGILEKEWGEIEKKLEITKSFAKSVHIDILDGKFAPGSTFLDPNPFSKYSQELFLEVHMMVENPLQYLESFAKAGFKRFIGQIEKMPDQAEFVAKAEALGEVGIAIDGPTELSEIKVPYGDLDCILIMSIKAGESGQIFNPEYLKKIKTIYSVTNNIKIEVDGGINDETILLARNAGVDRFVSTSFIFNNNPPRSSGPQAQFNLLNTAIAEKQKR